MASPLGHCPLCGPAPARRLFAARDLHSFRPGEHSVLTCEQCSLAYTDAPPRSEEMGRYYGPAYWITVERDRMIAGGVRKLAERIAAEHGGGRVLDVGCAAGRKTAFLRDHGLRVVGLDPYQEACELAAEYHGLETVCAYLQTADLPDGSFEAVTFLDTLEHVEDPVGDLRKAHSLLKAGGAVYIKVPNFGSLQARLLREYWAVLDVPRHRCHFSPRPLRRALEVAGFDGVECWSPPDPWGAYQFEISVLFWLRARQWSRRGLAPAADEGQTADEVLQGIVYPDVPRRTKQAFRWLVRHALYAPLSVENLIGRGAALLAIGRKA